MKTYFYEESQSPIASPLVIAPKAIYPFIRLCGNYTWPNQFIKRPHFPIPNVQYELHKIQNFKYYFDLDMANSFHQFSLSETASDLLSIITPWGTFRPKFMPEGVSPASGYLQMVMKDEEGWLIVIFDNILVLADDYKDAFVKFPRVIERCYERNVVLKMAKS
jgi:hypothetical protein